MNTEKATPRSTTPEHLSIAYRPGGGGGHDVESRKSILLRSTAKVSIRRTTPPNPWGPETETGTPNKLKGPAAVCA
jgi:hypothetical protein